MEKRSPSSGERGEHRRPDQAAEGHQQRLAGGALPEQRPAEEGHDDDIQRERKAVLDGVVPPAP